MAGPKQSRARQAPARTAAGKARNNGTRGGRPEAPPGGQAGPGGKSRAPGNGRAQRDRSRPDRQGPSSAAAARGADRPAGASLGMVLATLILSLGGLGVSIYLTIAHYTTPAIIACSDKGFVNCGAVTTSAESVVFGIFPVAVLGLAFYAFMVAVNSPWAWRSPLPAIRWARLGSVVVGMAFVLYLIYTELFTLGEICLWCTSVHVITFLLFGLIVFSAAASTGAAAARAGS